MTTASYNTVTTISEGLYKEKGSKFIAYAFPIIDERNVKNILQELHKKYYDARHICYAYRLGVKSIYERTNDDGEPKHSAGDPILGQIKSLELTNTLVAVIRYFGGTKLGVGGLINAYRTATQEALQHSKIEKKVLTAIITISFPYNNTNEVMRAIKNFEIEIVEQSFTEVCSIKGNIKEALLPNLQEAFSQIAAVRVD